MPGQAVERFVYNYAVSGEVRGSAREAGVTERTGCRWLQRGDVMERIEQARAEIHADIGAAVMLNARRATQKLNAALEQNGFGDPKVLLGAVKLARATYTDVRVRELEAENEALRNPEAAEVRSSTGRTRAELLAEQERMDLDVEEVCLPVRGDLAAEYLLRETFVAERSRRATAAGFVGGG